MRQKMTLVLVSVLMLLLAACGGAGGQGTSAPTAATGGESAPTAAPAPTEVPAEAPTADATGGEATAETSETAGGLPDLGGREVTIAVENAYPPFNYVNPATGEGEGWDYDAW